MKTLAASVVSIAVAALFFGYVPPLVAGCTILGVLIYAAIRNSFDGDINV